MTQLKRFFWFLLLFFWLLSLGILAHPTKAETVFELPETKLQRLIGNLQKLETLSENKSKLIAELKQISNEQSQEIKNLEIQLIESDKTIQALKQDSSLSKELIEKAEASSMKAWESFEKYKEAVRKEIRKLSRQRNIAIVLAILKWLL